MTRYRRVARQEFPSTDPARRGQVEVMYVYADESFQTVSFKIPLQEDSAQRVREELRKKAEAVAAGGEEEIEV